MGGVCGRCLWEVFVGGVYAGSSWEVFRVCFFESWGGGVFVEKVFERENVWVVNKFRMKQQFERVNSLIVFAALQHPAPFFIH